MRRRCCRPPALSGAGAPGVPEAVGTAARGAAPGRRYLALHLPRLPTDRLRPPGAEGREAPSATWGLRGGRKLLLAPDEAAEAAGLRAGQALADARAILPGLRAEPEDPAGVAALLERLAAWALRYGPLVGTDGADALLLDVAGCAWRYGETGWGRSDAAWDGVAEAALRDDAVLRLRRRGITAVGAVAGTPDAALALARGGSAAVVAPGGEAEAVSPLCLSALPIASAQRAALRRLGLWRVGDVLAQPRGPLARRFGAALPALLDGVAGRTGRPIRPSRPPPDFAAARDLPEPIITREALDAVLLLLLDALCVRLAENGRGARRVVLRAHGVDGEPQEVAVGTVAPSRDPAHLHRLFRDRLEALRPGFGFGRLVLRAERTDPQPVPQGGLVGSAAAAEAGRVALAAVLDRLAARLPVWRLEPRASHLPERAVVRAPAAGPETGTPAHWIEQPRPVRLLRRPEPVTVVAMLPDGPPARISWRGRALRVRRAEGPERLEPEWWRDAPERLPRDYYRVEVEGGERLWVCRVGEALPGLPARWYLHGHLP